MTDPDLILKKLARIESCVQELRTWGDASHLETDVRMRRFIEHTLQLAIQAAIDTAAHIVSDERLGEARNQRDLFDLLQRASWIEAALAGSLRRMVGFRNVLVHGYDEVDLEIVRDVLANRLDELLIFVTVVRSRIIPG